MSDRVTAESLLAHAGWVRSLARTLVSDEHRAEDVVQQTWLLALQKPPRHAGNLRGWLGQVARNAARAMGRQDSRRARREAKGAAEEASFHVESPEAIVHRASLQRTVVDAVLSLGEPYRSTILYRYFSELDPSRIAEMQDVPVETVRTRLKRAQQMLRVRLGHDFEDPSGKLLALLPLIQPASPGGATPMAQAGAASSATVPGFFLGALLMSPKILVTSFVLIVAAATVIGIQLWPDDIQADSTAIEPGRTSEVAELDPVGSESRAVPSDDVPESEVEAEEVDQSPPDEPRVPSTAVPAGCVLRGTVTSPAGEPASEAKVLLALPDAIHSLKVKQQVLTSFETLLENRRADSETVFEAWTDEKGRYEIAGVPEGPRWNVVALHETLGVALAPGVSLSFEASPLELDLRLLGGVHLQGRVTDAVGTPLVGASLTVSGEDNESYSVCAHVLTDEDGRFRTQRLPYSQFIVSADAEGYFGDWEKVVVAEGVTEQTVEFLLEKAPLLEGPIVDLAGAPAHLQALLSDRALERRQQPRLQLFGSINSPDSEPSFLSSFHRSGRVRIEEDRFELPLDSEGTRYLSLWWDETCLGTGEIRSGHLEKLMIDPSRIPDEVLPGSLTLEVSDANSGALLSDVEVSLSRQGSDRFRRIQTAQRWTEGGHWSEQDLEPGHYRLAVRAEGFASAWRELDIEDGGHEAIELRLQVAAATIRARVLGANGDPRNGAVVYLLNPDGTSVLPPLESKTESNAHGELAFEGLASGDYLLVARDGDDESGLAPVSRALAARPSGETELRLERGVKIAIDVEVSGPYSCRITNERGVPLFDDSRDGTRRFGGPFETYLTPGRYTVEVESPGYRTARESFVAESGLLFPVRLSQRD
ncbi:MAG: sigma-70 family RNA polymerase sigma factor [Planctomycetota bacterium]